MWDDLQKLNTVLSQAGLYHDFMELLFTHEEQATIKKRLLIIKELLSEEKTQRQIAKDLNVSISQITRGSNELKNISPNLKQLLLEQIKKIS